MSGYTPGTWTAHERRGMALGQYGHCIATDLHTKPGVVSGCDSIVDRIMGHTPEEALANARLIAAAPDLLAARKGLREACTDAYKTGRIDALAFVTAGNVIAEATGE